MNSQIWIFGCIPDFLGVLPVCIIYLSVLWSLLCPPSPVFVLFSQDTFWCGFYLTEHLFLLLVWFLFNVSVSLLILFHILYFLLRFAVCSLWRLSFQCLGFNSLDHAHVCLSLIWSLIHLKSRSLNISVSMVSFSSAWSPELCSYLPD